MLEKFGGHNQAAGLTLKYEVLDDFIEAIRQYCDNNLTPDLLVRSIDVDCVCQAYDLHDSFYEGMMKLSPFGQNNKIPILALEMVDITEFRMVGSAKNHLKFAVSKDGMEFGGIKFSYDGYMPTNIRGLKRADLCFELDKNYYNGVESLQLRLSDIRYYDPHSK